MICIITQKKLNSMISKAVKNAVNEDLTRDIKAGIKCAFNAIFNRDDSKWAFGEKWCGSTRDQIFDIFKKAISIRISSDVEAHVQSNLDNKITGEKILDSIVERILKKQLSK